MRRIIYLCLLHYTDLVLLDLNCSFIRSTLSVLGSGIAYCKHISNWIYAPVVCYTALELSVPTNSTTPETDDMSGYLRLPHCMLGMDYRVNETSVSQSS